MKFIFIFMLLFSHLFGEVIISDFGVGSTIKEAKKNALEALSSNLFTEIKTSLKLESLKDNNFDYNFGFKNTNIKSNMIFQDIKFKILSDKNGYKVKAIFDRDSLNKSISYLLLKTNIDYRTFKNKSEFELQREYLNILSAFHPYLLNSIKRKKIRNYVISKNNYLNKVQNLGSIMIYLNNPNIDDISIFIDNKVYPPNKPIYLSYGKHYYLVKGNDYFNKRGSFFINKNSDLILNLTMHKKHNYSFLYVMNNNVYNTHILELFEKENLPINLDINNPNYFNISIKVIDNGKKLYGTKTYTVRMDIEGFVDNKLVLRKKFYKNNVFETMIPLFLDKSIKDYIDSFYLNLENI